MPIQSNWILNVAVNLKFPFVERDFWPNAEIQHGKVMDLPLAGWQPVRGPYRRTFLPCHFSCPTLFGRDVCVLHRTNTLPDSFVDCQPECGRWATSYGLGMFKLGLGRVLVGAV